MVRLRENEPVCKTSDSAREGGELRMLEGFVWVCLAVAVLATVYILLQEPEDGVPRPWDAPLARYRLAAFAASVVAGVIGVVRIVARGGGPGLLGMAVLFNVVLAFFWALRFALVP